VTFWGTSHFLQLGCFGLDDIIYSIYTEHSDELVDLALRYRDKGVVGLDINAGEWMPLHQLHVDAFKVKDMLLLSFCFTKFMYYRKLKRQDCLSLFMLGKQDLHLISNE